MSSKQAVCPLDRRQFLGRAVPLGCLSCLAGPGLLAKSALAAPAAPAPHKFKADAQYSFEDAFKFAYAEALLPQLEPIAKAIGRERLIKLLRSAAEATGRRNGQKWAEGLAQPDFANHNAPTREPNRFMQHALTFTIVEDTPTAFAIKITECLWAKTFRDAQGADIGYAVICHGDIANARGYSPKLRLLRSKTLMQGHAFCDLRWVWEG
jgi:hypothetical protein